MPFITGIGDIDKLAEGAGTSLHIVAANDAGMRHAFMSQVAVETARADKDSAVVFYSLEIGEYPLTLEMHNLGLASDDGTLPANLAISAGKPKTGTGITEDVRRRNGGARPVSTVLVDCFQKMEATAAGMSSVQEIFGALVGSLGKLADEGFDVILSYDLRGADEVAGRIEPAMLRESAKHIILLHGGDAPSVEVDGTPVAVAFDGRRAITLAEPPVGADADPEAIEPEQAVEEAAGKVEAQVEAAPAEPEEPEGAPDLEAADDSSVESDTGEEAPETAPQPEAESPVEREEAEPVAQPEAVPEPEDEPFPERIRELAAASLSAIEDGGNKIVDEATFKLNVLVGSIRGLDVPEVLAYGKSIQASMFDFSRSSSDPEKVDGVISALKGIIDFGRVPEPEAEGKAVSKDAAADDGAELSEGQARPDRTDGEEAPAAGQEGRVTEKYADVDYMAAAVRKANRAYRNEPAEEEPARITSIREELASHLQDIPDSADEACLCGKLPDGAKTTIAAVAAGAAVICLFRALRK